MSFSFNKTARTASAVVIASLSLVGMAWADYQSGGDVGKFCAKQHPIPDVKAVAECCAGGCGDLHPDPTSQGFQLCTDKCAVAYVIADPLMN